LYWKEKKKKEKKDEEDESERYRCRLSKAGSEKAKPKTAGTSRAAGLTSRSYCIRCPTIFGIRPGGKKQLADQGQKTSIMAGVNRS